MGLEVNATLQQEACLEQRGFHVVQQISGQNYPPQTLGSCLEKGLESGIEWVFLCEESTYFVPERLCTLPAEGIDLIAGESLLIEGTPSRKTGYFLSRKLARCIVDECPDLREEDLLEFAKSRGFSWKVDLLLRRDRGRYPRRDNEIVSAHSSDARDLVLFHSSMKADTVLSARCAHEAWHGEIEFYDSGIACRPGTGDGGYWVELEDGNLLIDWFRFPREVFHHQGQDKGLLMSARHAGHVLGLDLMKIDIPVL